MNFEPNFAMFHLMSLIMPILVACVFLFVFVSMIVKAVRNGRENAKNNASPVLNVTATVTAKRTETQHITGNQTHLGRTRTTYFATFQVESGDRMEFSITGEQSGLLMEHDCGTLTFQGTRYLNFSRA